MGKKEESANFGRRNFLKLAAVSAPAVAAVAASGTAVQAAELNETGQGMRDTLHTKAYFETAKF